MKCKINNKEIEIKKATGFKMRLFGLMGKKDIHYGILFPPEFCSSFFQIILLNQFSTSFVLASI